MSSKSNRAFSRRIKVTGICFPQAHSDTHTHTHTHTPLTITTTNVDNSEVAFSLVFSPIISPKGPVRPRVWPDEPCEPSRLSLTGPYLGHLACKVPLRPAWSPFLQCIHTPDLGGSPHFGGWIKLSFGKTEKEAILSLRLPTCPAEAQLLYFMTRSLHPILGPKPTFLLAANRFH